MITTTSEFRSHCPSWPGAIGALRGADDAAEGGERRADDEGDRERELDVDAERRGHLAVVDAGADHHPRARAVEPDPEPEPDREAEEEHARGARASSRSPSSGSSTSRFVQPGQVTRRGEALVEVGDHLVGDDHRDRDRDQRLPQLLTLVPAQEDLLHDEADEHRSRAAATSAGNTHSQVVTSVPAIVKPAPVIFCCTS